MAVSRDRPAAFASIFDRHAGAVHRFVGYRVRESLIDDVVADVFRTAFESRATFDTTAASAKPWLLGIATNVIRHQYRSEARQGRSVQRSARQSSVSIDPLLVIDDGIDARSEIGGIAEALDSLSGAERETLLMTAWDGLSPTEIGEIMGVPSETVRTRLHRGRHKLRRALTDVRTAAFADGSEES